MGRIFCSHKERAVRRILVRYDQNLENWNKLGRPLYRAREDRLTDIKKNKSTWFRDGGDTATLMVPCTPGSALAKELREVLKRNPGPKGTQVRVVERPGNKS